MKTTRTAHTILTCLTCLVMAGAARGSETVVDLARVKEIVVPLERVLEKGKAQLKGRVIEAEILQRGAALVYEILILEKNGIVRAYNFDARTGGFLGEQKGD